MLALDSPRWRHLKSTYGPATNTPSLLKRLLRPDGASDGDAWADLFASVVHQGTVSEAAYACVPHIVAAAARTPPSERVQFLAFAAAVRNSTDAAPLPSDLQQDYNDAITLAGGLTVDTLQHERLNESDAVYLLVAAAALHGHGPLANALEGIADQGFNLNCPLCDQELTATVAQDAIRLQADDSRGRAAGAATIVEPAPPSGPSRSVDAEAFKFIRAVAFHQEHPGLSVALDAIFGVARCPACARTFNLLDGLEPSR